MFAMLKPAVLLAMVSAAHGCKSTRDRVKGAKSEVESVVNIENDDNHMGVIVTVLIGCLSLFLSLLCIYCCARRLGLTRNLRRVARGGGGDNGANATNQGISILPGPSRQSEIPRYMSAPMGLRRPAVEYELPTIKRVGDDLILSPSELELLREMRARDAANTAALSG